ncbi:MAG: hypothetical protein ACFFG0_45575, partial [Candidatus Thorarchaeota archaeon]
MAKKINPRELEKDFNNIKREIDLCVHSRDNFSIPNEEIFKGFDIEYELVKEVYVINSDLCNLFHIEHNYNSTKVYQYLDKSNNYRCLNFFLDAMKNLLLRHQTRRYNISPLKKMISTYKSTWVKICEYNVEIEIENLNHFEDFINFCLNYSGDFDSELQNLLKYVIDYFLKKIDEILLSKPIITKEILEYFSKRTETYKKLIEIAKKLPDFKHYLFTKNYESLYRLKKNILHYYLNYRKENTIIEEITEDLMSYSDMSLKHGRRHINKLKNEEKEIFKSIIVYKELDLLHAYFYYHLYGKKDILKALDTMNNIKEFLVKNAFSNNIKFSEPLLHYFADEFILIENYCNLVILKEKINNDVEDINQDWIKLLFNNIKEVLESNVSQFRYEYELKGGYKLGILSSTFAGYFSEFIIHYLLLKFKEHDGDTSKVSKNYKSILNDVISISNEEEIILNDTETVENTEIDIQIKGKCATCHHLKYCGGGCRVTAEYITGDFFGS